MKREVLEYRQLSPTSRFVQQKPPAAISYFVYIILVIVLSALAYSWFTSIEVVVSAPATLRPGSTVNTVSALVDGQVENVYLRQGMDVEIGSPLIDFDSSLYRDELIRVQDRIIGLEERWERLTRLKTAISASANPFDELAEGEFFHRYESYRSTLAQLDLSREAAAEEYRLNAMVPGKISQSELSQLYRRMRVSELAVQQHISSTQVDLASEAEALESDIDALNARADELVAQIQYMKITAPAAGRVQLLDELAVGDNYFAGQPILEIVPAYGYEIVAEIGISNQDIAGVKIGDPIVYQAPSLPQEDFGIFRGRIISIPVNLHDAGDQRFIVTGSMNRYNSRGELIDLDVVKHGMYVDARITVMRRKLLYLILDTLNLLPKHNAVM
jgi:multidrug resistance efflux pump